LSREITGKNYVLDNGNRSSTSKRWVPLRKEDINALRWSPDDVALNDDISFCDFTFKDTRLLVANLALMVPVWEAVTFATAILTRTNDSQMQTDLGQLDQNPKSRRAMLQRPDRNLWEIAEQEEIKKIEERQVWEPVPSREAGDSVRARGLWVYSSKKDIQGNILKRKARLVIMGNLVPTSEELFAPTTSLDNIRLLLSLAAGNGYEVSFRDVSSAFLYGELEEPVFLIPPEIMNLPKHTLLKVTKSLYGLRQSPRRWFLRFSHEMKVLGCRGIGNDEVIFEYRSKGNAKLLLGVFVDDLVIISETKAVKDEFLSRLNSIFDFSGSEETGTFLGIRIVQDLRQGTITLSQEHFIEQTIEKFQIPCLQKVYTVLPGTYLKSYHLDDELLNKQEIKTYQALLGTILYISNCTRVDICFATSLLSRFSRFPRKRDLTALYHLARYLYTTKQLHIEYHSHGVSFEGNTHHNELVAFSDASWGTEIESRKSQSGFGAVMNGGVVFYGSKLQKVVALSSSEAEIYAVSVCSKLVKQYRALLTEMGFVQTRPTMLLIDNEPCIRLLWDKRSFSRLKHIDIRTKFSVNLVENAEIIPIKIHTKYQPADLLTKVLPVSRWLEIASFLFGAEVCID